MSCAQVRMYDFFRSMFESRFRIGTCLTNSRYRRALIETFGQSKIVEYFVF